MICWRCIVTALSLLTANAANAANAEHTASASSPPDLFSPLYVSPAQQGTVKKPTLEGGLSYLSESLTSTFDDAFGTTTFHGTSSFKNSTPLLGLGAVVPVGPMVRVGVEMIYAQLTSQQTFTSTSTPSDSGSNDTSSTKGTDRLIDVAPLVALDFGGGFTAGVQYFYDDTKSTSTSTGSLASDSSSDTSLEWGGRARFGAQAVFNKTTLGVAYETRERKLTAPPGITVYGSQAIKGLCEAGLIMTYYYNEAKEGGIPGGPGNVLDATGTFAVYTGGSGKLTFLAGYLPESTAFLDSHLSILRFFGYGYHLGIDYDAPLGKALTLGAGLSYDSVGAAAGGKTSGSGFQPAVRLAYQI